MILRRTTKHVRDQNWFAVGLDFFIVVVGVFFGIQIGNWNETRLDQKAYEQAHDRMVIEAKGNIEKLEHTLDLYATMTENFQNAIEDIRTCSDDEAAKNRIDAAVEALYTTISPSYHTTAISHLTTSERLLERQTAERREQYLEYSKSLNQRKAWSQTMFENMEARLNDLHPFLDYGAFKTKTERNNWDDAIWGDYRPLELVVEPGVACQDDAFRKLFYRWESGQTYQMNLMTAAVVDTKTYLEELGENPENPAAQQ